jgi:polar amino acid transport system permease protein
VNRKSSLLSLFLAPAREDGGSVRRPALFLNAVLVLGLLALLFTFAFQQLEYRWNWGAPWRYRRLLFQGWITTVLVAAASLVLSTLLGVTAALLERSRLLAARMAARVYVELIRGTPLLVQILLLFYVVAPMFHLGNRMVAGVLTLSIFAGAYIGEIVRAGIASIGVSQWETARSLGLTRTQTYRLVVLPQALRQILPPLTGQFVSLIKDSSLLSVIGIGEFALQAQQINSLTYSTLESYLPLALGYLVLTFPLSLWARHLERRAHFDT